MHRITKLPSGLTIATLPSTAHFYSLGCYVAAGSVREQKQTLGSALAIDKLSFGSTVSHPRADLTKLIEGVGGCIQVQAAREHISYSSLLFPKDLEKMSHLLSVLHINTGNGAETIISVPRTAGDEGEYEVGNQYAAMAASDYSARVSACRCIQHDAVQRCYYEFQTVWDGDTGQFFDIGQRGVGGD